jgi:hypothetical protein
VFGQRSPFAKGMDDLRTFSSPSYLSFHDGTDFYECSELLAYESWLRGLLSQNVQDPGFDSERRPKFPRMVNEMSWNRIVCLYSRATLTLSSDKLVAFSRITHHFRIVTGNEYVTGLSRHNLERNLCWGWGVSPSYYGYFQVRWDMHYGALGRGSVVVAELHESACSVLR